MDEIDLANINDSLKKLENELFECEYRYYQSLGKIDEQYLEFCKIARDLKMEEGLIELNKKKRNLEGKLQDQYLKSRRKIENYIERIECLRKENI